MDWLWWIASSVLFSYLFIRRAPPLYFIEFPFICNLISHNLFQDWRLYKCILWQLGDHHQRSTRWQVEGMWVSQCHISMSAGSCITLLFFKIIYLLFQFWSKRTDDATQKHKPDTADKHLKTWHGHQAPWDCQVFLTNKICTGHGQVVWDKPGLYLPNVVHFKCGKETLKYVFWRIDLSPFCAVCKWTSVPKTWEKQVECLVYILLVI